MQIIIIIILVQKIIIRVMLTGASWAPVKELKIEIKDKFHNKTNTFSTFNK